MSEILPKQRETQQHETTGLYMYLFVVDVFVFVLKREDHESFSNFTSSIRDSLKLTKISFPVMLFVQQENVTMQPWKNNPCVKSRVILNNVSQHSLLLIG